MYHFSCVHVFSAAGLSMPSCLEHSGFQVTDTIHGIVYEPSKSEHPLQLSRLSLALGIKKCFCFCFVFKKETGNALVKWHQLRCILCYTARGPVSTVLNAGAKCVFMSPFLLFPQ